MPVHQRVWYRPYPRHDADRKANSSLEILWPKCMECTMAFEIRGESQPRASFQLMRRSLIRSDPRVSHFTESKKPLGYTDVGDDRSVI